MNKDYFKNFLESINGNESLVKSITEGYESLLESHRISEYEYYKNFLNNDSNFNEILMMVKNATSDKQRTFLINNLIKRIEELAGSFDRNMIKLLLEYFQIPLPVSFK